jgi:hypothetical protein
MLERRIKVDRRCYKKRQDPTTRSIKNGEGRLTEHVKEKKRENMKKKLIC